MEQFTFYELYADILQSMDDVSAGKLASCICAYEFEDREPAEELSDKENFYWSNIADILQEVKETEKGLSYKDYLRILLFLKDTKEVTMRLADRIEENIRSQPEKEYFRIDQCVTKLEIENKVTVYGDISYTFPAYFGYQ